jgi:hypothetical protein
MSLNEKNKLLKRTPPKKQFLTSSAQSHFNIKRPETTKEIKDHFEQRRKRLQVIKTTVTPSGQILDWVPFESQPHVGSVPKLPDLKQAGLRQREKPIRLAGFELEDAKVDRGPNGTIPILRKDFSKRCALGSLKTYLAKVHAEGRHLHGLVKRPSPAPPSPFGYFHSYCSQSINCAGAAGSLGVWAPYVDDGNGVPNFLGIPLDPGHSIVQTWLLNFDNPQVQTLEAGWTVDWGLNGDYEPPSVHILHHERLSTRR